MLLVRELEFVHPDQDLVCILSSLALCLTIPTSAGVWPEGFVQCPVIFRGLGYPSVGWL